MIVSVLQIKFYIQPVCTSKKLTKGTIITYKRGANNINEIHRIV